MIQGGFFGSKIEYFENIIRNVCYGCENNELCNAYFTWLNCWGCWVATSQSFFQVGSAPKSNPWPFCLPFLTEKIPLSCSWFSHDVTKIQTKKLSPLLSFYFHVILEHLKTFIQTNFRFKRVLCFAIQDAWISRLLRNAAFSWRPGKLLCGLKTLRIFGDFAISLS